jgi:hypothetical protein
MRTSMLSLAFVALVGCAAPADKDEDDAGGGTADDSATPEDEDDGSANEVEADELNGTVPDTALPAPEFVATNRDGGARAREDLLGHPTVMWFYPAAATAG